MSNYSVLAYGRHIPLERCKEQITLPKYGGVEVYGFKTAESKITSGTSLLETAWTAPAETVFAVLRTGQIVLLNEWDGKVFKNGWFTRSTVKSGDMFSE